MVNVELDAYSAEPVREQNLDNVRGTLSREPLPAHKVREGRARERLKMQQHSVFRRVRLRDARGKRVRGMWLQDWKVGTDQVRCRFVAQQVAYTVRDDTFAGTPPLKFVRLALVLAARLRRGTRLYLVGLWDVSNAFFHAYLDEEVYVVPPAGEDEPGVVWQLLKALYGTRKASKMFQELVIQVLTQQGFIRLQVTIMVFFHVELDIFVVVHGDDFLGVASVGNL